MPRESKTLLILKYLYQNTDMDHTVTTLQIKEMLQEHGIHVDTRTVYSAVRQMIEAGHDISILHVQGTDTKYRVNSRFFETAELKLLIDAISASQFIGLDKSRELIKKLSSMASKADEERLSANRIAAEQIKAVRSGALCVADDLRRGIDAGKKITYQQIEFSAPTMEKVLHRDGYVYTLSPYALIWVNDRYYLVGLDEDEQIMRTPRVDHITNVTITEEDAAPAPDDFDVGYYYNKVYKMYDGETQEITLAFKKDLAGKIVDRFGTELSCVPAEKKDWFNVTVETVISPTFYGWLAQYGGDIRMAGPEEAVKAYHKHMRRAMKLIIQTSTITVMA